MCFHVADIVSAASNYIFLEPRTVDSKHIPTWTRKGAPSAANRTPARPRILPCARIDPFHAPTRGRCIDRQAPQLNGWDSRQPRRRVLMCTLLPLEPGLEHHLTPCTCLTLAIHRSATRMLLTAPHTSRQVGQSVLTTQQPLGVTAAAARWSGTWLRAV